MKMVRKSEVVAESTLLNIFVTTLLSQIKYINGSMGECNRCMIVSELFFHRYSAHFSISGSADFCLLIAGISILASDVAVI